MSGALTVNRSCPEARVPAPWSYDQPSFWPRRNVMGTVGRSRRGRGWRVVLVALQKAFPRECQAPRVFAVIRATDRLEEASRLRMSREWIGGAVRWLEGPWTRCFETGRARQKNLTPLIAS